MSKQISVKVWLHFLLGNTAPRDKKERGKNEIIFSLHLLEQMPSMWSLGASLASWGIGLAALDQFSIGFGL
ncbi:hypothetical protein TNCT_3671 [Trichonephila clavata]|uniref:Uncharacterized protein n=1 Tax=Trichonephila clavata TaxID=2740835 RepID=A0A8X6HX65_TRICU|nr:hypothetical protein TNCT_3671 [Trichonephila clavata]